MKCYRCGSSAPLQLLKVSLLSSVIFDEHLCDNCIIDITTKLNVPPRQLNGKTMAIVKRRFAWRRKKKGKTWKFRWVKIP